MNKFVLSSFLIAAIFMAQLPSNSACFSGRGGNSSNRRPSSSNSNSGGMDTATMTMAAGGFGKRRAISKRSAGKLPTYSFVGEILINNAF